MSKVVLLRVFAVAVIALLVACGGGGGGGDEPLTRLDAEQQLSDKVSAIDWTADSPPQVGVLPDDDLSEIADALPPIDEFELVVRPQVGGNDVVVEIFVSTEKSGEGTDGWLVEVAQEFNSEARQLSGGQAAKVQIRKIPSGTGYQFISSGRHLPQAFSPSNHLWIQMAAESVAMTPIRESLVGNVAGIVMTSEVAEELSPGGSLDVQTVIQAVVERRIDMGYTNPFASSTGLNFLAATLDSFSGGQEDQWLSPDVASTLEQFQAGVPFVALTTLQIRESVEKGGSLDAFVMEYQTYVNTGSLQDGFEFIPFGITHDNPLYGVGTLSPEQLEALESFAAFAEQEQFVEKATDVGFNPTLQYDSSYDIPSGATLVEAQKLWKEKKDAGRPVVALFVTDVSGSMQGAKIRGVQNALVAGSDHISAGNSVGLVSVNESVRVVLPIGQFDSLQKARFIEVVENLDAAGGTAMYDGVAVALSLLVEKVKLDPEIKPILFVLTDGETVDGLTFDSVDEIIEGIRIPVYTIGYEANVPELSRLSSLVEAASIDAGQQDVAFQIASLLNAEL